MERKVTDSSDIAVSRDKPWLPTQRRSLFLLLSVNLRHLYELFPGNWYCWEVSISLVIVYHDHVAYWLRGSQFKAAAPLGICTQWSPIELSKTFCATNHGMSSHVYLTGYINGRHYHSNSVRHGVPAVLLDPLIIILHSSRQDSIRFMLAMNVALAAVIAWRNHKPVYYDY